MANALIRADAAERAAGDSVTSAMEAAYCLAGTIGWLRLEVPGLSSVDMSSAELSCDELGSWQIACREVFLRPCWKYLPIVQSTWTLKHL